MLVSHSICVCVFFYSKMILMIFFKIRNDLKALNLVVMVMIDDDFCISRQLKQQQWPVICLSCNQLKCFELKHVYHFHATISTNFFQVTEHHDIAIEWMPYINNNFNINKLLEMMFFFFFYKEGNLFCLANGLDWIEIVISVFYFNNNVRWCARKAIDLIS